MNLKKNMVYYLLLVCFLSLFSTSAFAAGRNRTPRVCLKHGMAFMKYNYCPLSSKDKVISPTEWRGVCLEHNYSLKILPSEIWDAGGCIYDSKQLSPEFSTWRCPNPSDKIPFSLSQEECPSGIAMVEKQRFLFPYLCSKCLTVFIDMPAGNKCPVCKKSEVADVRTRENINQ